MFDKAKVTIMSPQMGDKISTRLNNRVNSVCYEIESARVFMAQPLLYTDIEINPNGGETDGKERDT
jgi:hypothetical protein